MSDPLVAFHGPVAVERASAFGARLTLLGTAGEGRAEPTALTFSGAAPAGLVSFGSAIISPGHASPRSIRALQNYFLYSTSEHLSSTHVAKIKNNCAMET